MQGDENQRTPYIPHILHDSDVLAPHTRGRSTSTAGRGESRGRHTRWAVVAAAGKHGSGRARRGGGRLWRRQPGRAAARRPPLLTIRIKIEYIDPILRGAINPQYYCQYLEVSSLLPLCCHPKTRVKHGECLEIATESLKIAQNRSKLARNRSPKRPKRLIFAAPWPNLPSIVNTIVNT